MNAEITRILSELFADNDRHLINLYSKALQKLDNMFSSSDEEKQYRAMDRIIKIFLQGQPRIQSYSNILAINRNKKKSLSMTLICLMRKGIRICRK